jgi:alkylhydroperoxidase family enzyme
MPRLPYLPADLREPEAIVAPIRARRGGQLLHLDRMLLHSPPFARGWNAFLGEVRTGLALSARLRELAMCVVAVVNRAEYEFHHHAPEFLKAGGSAAQVAALRDPERAVRNIELFNAAQRATIRLDVDMTREIEVSPQDFEAVKAQLPGPQEVVELIGVIAAYNMVSRFLVALGIEPE